MPSNESARNIKNERISIECALHVSLQLCVDDCTGGSISSVELQLHRVETCGNPADNMAHIEGAGSC